MNRTILSINKNKSMSYLLQTILSDRYSFITVSDVFEGMNVIKKDDRISLVIVDTDHIETGDASDFLELITTSGLYQRPVIVLTSDKNSDLGEKMSGLNINELFVKPFSPTELIRKIDNLIRTEIVNN